MTTTADDVWRLLAELITAQKETDRRFQETDKQIKRVGKQIGQLGNRLGEFVESEVRPSAVRLFRQRDIDVHELHSGVTVKRDDGGLEIDLLVVNNTEVVLVEVKSKLNQRDIDEHLERLNKFKRLMPRYQDMRAYGAVGAMIVTDEVANYAYQKGLFVLTQNGDNVIITNDENFKPTTW
ncbi:MAG: NERD domain-containing protein [Cyanobacterium sp. T60_A2020_053]|nr:NERD domain-containing protein [Cyanobacterium sp. T60_A2020_053]